MKEIPMLFSTPMVHAILAGRKSKTRRLLKDEHVLYNLDVNNFIPEYYHNDKEGWCPYGKPGDLIWVRETWGIGCRPDPFQGSIDGIEFKADSMFIDDIESLPLHLYEDFDFGNYDKSGWRPSIHMPKTIARIWLRVTEVRVERLQDISEEDAKAEGIQSAGCEDHLACPSKLCISECVDKDNWWNYMAPDGENFPCFTAKESFESLWHSINGRESWEVNPWVWVVSFKILSTTGKPKEVII